jgi:hypothetical protein
MHKVWSIRDQQAEGSYNMLNDIPIMMVAMMYSESTKDVSGRLQIC